MYIETWYGSIWFNRYYWKPAFEVVVSDPGRMMMGRRKHEEVEAGERRRGGIGGRYLTIRIMEGGVVDCHAFVDGKRI
jgi:hypothetical protein